MARKNDLDNTVVDSSSSSTSSRHRWNHNGSGGGGGGYGASFSLSTFANLFPTKASFIIFIAYMVLFINQGLLVTASKNEKNKFNYNPVTVVLITELLKLIISSIIYLKDNSIKVMFHEISRNKKVMLKYFIPSFLYCLYNNLTFVNLSSYDPTTYFLLLQFRVVITGVVFQMLFDKRLTRHQWLSLFLLTFGCIIKQINYSSSSASSSAANTAAAVSDSEFNLGTYININLFLILLQVLCSCFAGVYNEYILKEKDNQVDIMLQNVFMYIDSIICGILFLGIYTPADSTFDSSSGSSSSLRAVFSIESLRPLWDLKVILIIVNNATVGIVTSLFLKSLNSILKTFASALEIMFTAVLAWILFGIALDLSTCLAIGVVSLATWLYSINPVNNSAHHSNGHVKTGNGGMNTSSSLLSSSSSSSSPDASISQMPLLNSTSKDPNNIV